MQLPILITGIAGVAGYNAFHYFRAKYPGQVIGIRQTNNWKFNSAGIVACDAEDENRLRRLFDKYQFKCVLNAAGNCALKACELNPELAWKTNVLGVQTLLKVMRGSNLPLIHLSIDLVFSGKSTGNHLETDSPDPVSMYGKTMVEAEEYVQEHYPSACILRISLPMGVSFNGHAGAIDWIESRFKKDRPATLYYDEVRTPTYVGCMNRLFESIYQKNLSGLYHAGGPRKLSLYEIAQVVNRVGGYDPDLLQGCPRFDGGPIPPRAGNVTMNSSKLNLAIGYEPFAPWPNDESLVPTTQDWHYHRPGEEPGSREFLEATLYCNPATSECVPVL